jgi:hypothetical protein
MPAAVLLVEGGVDLSDDADDFLVVLAELVEDLLL